MLNLWKGKKGQFHRLYLGMVSDFTCRPLYYGCSVKPQTYDEKEQTTMKKVFAMLMTLTLALSLLAGCGSSQENH